MELTGTIVKIKETETITAKTESGKDFLKREVWLEIPDGKYPQTINLEFHGEKTTLIDGHTEGQEITVEINLKGKIVGEKCWNTLQVWRIVK
jgi:hypothetical protein